MSKVTAVLLTFIVTFIFVLSTLGNDYVNKQKREAIYRGLATFNDKGEFIWIK